MKTQLGLGVLSIPGVFDSLGIVPGIICMLAIACITTWSNYVIGTFKRNHPEVYAVDDAGELMFGWIGREVLGAGMCICESPSRAGSLVFLLTYTWQTGFLSLAQAC